MKIRWCWRWWWWFGDACNSMKKPWFLNSSTITLWNFLSVKVWVKSTQRKLCHHFKYPHAKNADVSDFSANSFEEYSSYVRCKQASWNCNFFQEENDNNQQLFESLKIYTAEETEARQEVMYENYIQEVMYENYISPLCCLSEDIIMREVLGQNTVVFCVLIPVGFLSDSGPWLIKGCLDKGQPPSQAMKS